MLFFVSETKISTVTEFKFPQVLTAYFDIRCHDRFQLVKPICEFEPQLRDIIHTSFASPNTPPVNNLLLDIYLAPRVPTLYTKIRNRALIQYFRYRNCSFSAHSGTLINFLLLSGQIQAWIDSHNKALIWKRNLRSCNSFYSCNFPNYINANLFFIFYSDIVCERCRPTKLYFWTGAKFRRRIQEKKTKFACASSRRFAQSDTRK